MILNFHKNMAINRQTMQRMQHFLIINDVSKKYFYKNAKIKFVKKM